MTRASDFVPLNGISRRTFCKGAAVLGIWGGLASFGLAGCAPRTRAARLASSAPWKAGTYTAEVTGRNAPYAMTVTFTDDAIGCTNIKPCAQGEDMALALGAGAERDVLCKNIFAQPDGTYWIVVNTLRYPDPDEPDANGATINNMLALGHIVAGDTVEALAGEMGVDAANLQASIDAYNAVVEGGTDEFGFVADNTADAAMTEGPWYACRKVPTVHHTMGGIRVNVESEACNADGEPIPGLYAAGECTGGIHGENRLGGNAIADCMTFGRNAGTNAAKYALA